MFQKKIVIALLFFFSFNLLSAVFVNAKTYSDLTKSEKAYWITGSVLITPVYLPYKCLYTGIGLVSSGVVLICSAGFAHDKALSMAKSSIGGDWYIHPDYLLGNRKLRIFEPPMAPVASSMPAAIPPVSTSQPVTAPSMAPATTPTEPQAPAQVSAPEAPAPAPESLPSEPAPTK